MHKLKYTDLYLSMSQLTDSAFQYIDQCHVDANLLLPVHSRLEQDVMLSVERLSQTSVSLPNVTREIVEYVSALKQSALRYLSVIEKQKTLVVDSISPLVKANNAFKEIYGPKKFSSLEQVSVNYFTKDEAHPFNLLNALSDAVLHNDPDHIRVLCHEHMNCKVTDGQLEYPSLDRITSVKFKSLLQFGYTPSEFNQELQEYTGEKGKAPYLSLVSMKQNIIKHLNQQADSAITDMKNVRPGRTNFKTQMRSVANKIGDLQSTTVALSTIMFLLQSASSSAYDAGYQLHLAELNFQNY